MLIIFIYIYRSIIFYHLLIFVLFFRTPGFSDLLKDTSLITTEYTTKVP